MSSASLLRAPSARPGNELADYYAETLLNDARKFVDEVMMMDAFTGFLTFYGEEVTRWSRDMPLPHELTPGALVVASTGHVFRGVGGDTQNGCEHFATIYTPAA